MPITQKRLNKLPKVTEPICVKVGLHNKDSLWTPMFSNIKITQEALRAESKD